MRTRVKKKFTIIFLSRIFLSRTSSRRRSIIFAGFRHLAEHERGKADFHLVAVIAIEIAEQCLRLPVSILSLRSLRLN